MQPTPFSVWLDIEALSRPDPPHVALPIWLDPKADAAGAWGVPGLPTTLIIDRQGRERGRFEGAVDWAADLEAAVVAAAEPMPARKTSRRIPRC